jgi:NAD(P)-dependent dehydrogenase (short-subunit alcohol dehydrogenase family)
VTGAGGAIGRALLAAFAAAGHRTVGVDLSAEAPDDVPVDRWFAGDVTVPADMRRVVEATVADFGRLDVLVNNAGVTALGSLEDTDDETFRRVMDVNLHGAVHATRGALEALKVSRGQVVVLSSVAGFAPVAGRPAYTASKHAVTGLFESLRPELARAGIGVTMVHPSFLRSAPADLNHPDSAPGARSVTGGYLDPDEVARAIVAAVLRRRARLLIGRTAWLAYHVHRLAPGLYARMMARRLT